MHVRDLVHNRSLRRSQASGGAFWSPDGAAIQTARQDTVWSFAVGANTTIRVLGQLEVYDVIPGLKGLEVLADGTLI